MSHFLLSALNAWGREAVLAALQLSLHLLVLTVALLLLDGWVRHRVRAALRYGLWMLIVVRLWLPPDLLSPTSVAYWVGPWLNPPRAEIAPLEWRFTLHELQEAMPLPMAVVPLALSAPPSLTIHAVLLLGWLGGAALFAGWTWRGQRRVAGLVRSAGPAPATSLPCAS